MTLTLSTTIRAKRVLIYLQNAPQKRLRMAELADSVLLSRSGVTRLVDRLERAGHVIRERVDGDGRGVVARLTPAGANRLGIAARTHLAGVVRHFVELLDEQELAVIARLTQRIADAQP